MRRFWIVPATLVVTVGLTATAATAAGAAVPAARPSVSCSDLLNRYQKVNSSASRINPSSPTSFSQVMNQVISAFNSLAKNGPSQLRGAFRDLARLYAPLRNVNLSNPASLSKLEGLATSSRLQNDLHRIETYFSSVCHITLPTAPSS